MVATAIVAGASQADHDRLGQAVEDRIATAGGPPEGLMAHLAYPVGDGFAIVNVWRTEELCTAWWAEVLVPALTEVGLEPGERRIEPVWSLARP